MALLLVDIHAIEWRFIDSTAMPTLLIVDDQAPVCAALATLLGRRGYRVLTAGSGAAAIALAETEAIDGALVDVHMPALDGFETCRRLQALARERRQALRLWFITGHPTRSAEAAAAALGALGILPKPFDFARLLALIEAGLASPLPSGSPHVS